MGKQKFVHEFDMTFLTVTVDIISCILSQQQQAGQELKEAKEVSLVFQVPPIEKMDASLSNLASCE